jgi:hypothetical protein
MVRPTREQIEKAQEHAATMLQFYVEYDCGESDDAKTLRVLLAATAKKPANGCDECEDGIVLADTCPTCDQEVWKTCPKCGGAK